MNKYFVPHNESIELGELGFNEECLLAYNRFKELYGDDSNFDMRNSTISDVTAPLYAQAFEWFREKGYHHMIYDEVDNTFLFTVSRQMKGFNIAGDEVIKRIVIIVDHTNTYEEAELQCLKKMIETYKANKP